MWRSGWLFAGHSCEILNPGQYFTLEVDSDSILVTRDETGQPHGKKDLPTMRLDSNSAAFSGNMTIEEDPIHTRGKRSAASRRARDRRSQYHCSRVGVST